MLLTSLRYNPVAKENFSAASKQWRATLPVFDVPRPTITIPAFTPISSMNMILPLTFSVYSATISFSESFVSSSITFFRTSHCLMVLSDTRCSASPRNYEKTKKCKAPSPRHHFVADKHLSNQRSSDFGQIDTLFEPNRAYPADFIVNYDVQILAIKHAFVTIEQDSCWRFIDRKGKKLELANYV